MNGFNAWIAKRNFKKNCIICIIAAVLCGLFCAGAVGYVYRDKVNLALQYEKASRSVKKEQDTAKHGCIGGFVKRYLRCVAFG